jgi:hypothetical protein
MKYMTVLSILAAVSTLADPSSTQAQDRGSPSGRSSLPQPSNEFFVGSGGIGFYPPSEVPPKTCVYNNVIHSAGARICVEYDLATCTQAGTWDISEKGARDAPRCNR